MSSAQINVSRIRELRGKRSREAVAHEMRRRGHGTDAKSVWRWENGHNQPSARVLVDYADVLGCTVEDLLGDQDDEEPPSMTPPVAVMSLAEQLHELAALASFLDRNPQLRIQLAEDLA